MRYPINEELARRAKEAYSMSDYVPGSATAEYESACAEVKTLGEKCKPHSYDPDKIDYLVDVFCRKYADWMNRFNANTASCPSILIAGGSNFPVRKKEKQNAREDHLWAEYHEIMAIKEKIKGVGHTIQSDNPDALKLLQRKLDELKSDQADMKEANAYFRKHKTMKGYKNLSDEGAAKIDAEIERGYSWEKQPYPGYHLTNNNATIRATEKRLSELTAKAEKAAEAPQTEQNINGVKVIENAEIDRLQLIFDGKPSEEIRTALKSHGFRWSPHYTAWQRQLTNNARYDANKILKQIA